MKVLIIEDEIPAQQLLLRLLKKYYPDFLVVEILDSVATSIDWLRNNSADLVFMDVELSDGNCFEIFKDVEINSAVIITTAYENYALNAFKTKCLDYIMKPIEDHVFKESVQRCLRFCNHSSSSLKKEKKDKTPNYKQRFTINLGSQIVVVDVNKIAYFYSEDKSTYIVTYDSKQFLFDQSLDSVEEEIDPSLFFKISRGCLAGLNSIDNISKYFNSRLKVSLKPSNIDPVLVSRARAQSFLQWLEGKN